VVLHRAPSPYPQSPGRPRVHTLREILGAIFFYIVRSGCAWRLLPHDFPPWKTIHHYFRTWRLDGSWERVHAALRKRLRVRLKRDPQPTERRRSVDSQSVKSIGVGGDQDAPKTGRRNVPTPLSSVAGRRLPRRGQGPGHWVEKTLGWSVDLVERPRKPAAKEVLMAWAREWAKEGVELDWQKLMPPQGFVVLPRRWVVERMFSWIDQNRRMSKDYERLPESGEAFIYVAMSRLMTRRLARS
jgi:putative transposase